MIYTVFVEDILLGKVMKMEASMKWLGMWLICLWVPGVALSADKVTTQNIGMELANDIAKESVFVCRQAGYQVSAVVVDRFGIVRAVLRDDLAARFTLQIAKDKANMSVMSGLKSGDFRQKRPDIRQELNHIRGLIVMQRGVPIVSQGIRIGALGVSGAPGGEKDEKCALKALHKFEDRLDF